MKLYHSTQSGITAYLMRDIRKKDPGCRRTLPAKGVPRVTCNRQRESFTHSPLVAGKMAADEWERFEAADLKDFDYKNKLGHKEIRTWWNISKLRPSSKTIC